MDLVPKVRADPLHNFKSESDMCQHSKGFSPSVPVNPESLSIRSVLPIAIPRLALGTDLMFIWRRKGLIAFTVAAALLLSVGADLVITPKYRAVSQIFIGPVDLRVVEKTVMPPAQTADANVIQVESETRILTSDRVLLRVVQNEKLTADPEFGAGGRSLMSRLRVALGLGSEAKTGDPELAALRQLQRDVSAKRSERPYVVDLTVDTADPAKSPRTPNSIPPPY